MLKKLIVTLLLFATGVYSQVEIVYTANINGALSGCGCPLSPYSGLDRIAGLLESKKKSGAEMIIVDSGDFFGTYPAKKRDAYVWKSLNRSGYDILLPGDQEFIYGAAYLSGLAKNSDITFLNGSLSGENFKSAKIIRKAGLRIGFLGYHGDECAPDLKGVTLNADKLSNLIGQIKNIRPECDYLILLSHAGVDENIELAEKITGIDVIIGSHTQETADTLVNGIRILQPGVDAEKAGVLKLKSKELAPGLLENKFIQMDKTVPRDSVIYRYYLDYSKQ